MFLTRSRGTLVYMWFATARLLNCPTCSTAGILRLVGRWSTLTFILLSLFIICSPYISLQQDYGMFTQVSRDPGHGFPGVFQ